MKTIPDWRKTLHSVIEQKRGVPAPVGENLRLFFEHAFRYAQEPSASWFGFHQSRVSLVIGNYFLAALGSKGIWLLVDSEAPSVPGFEVVPTSRSSLIWLFSPDLASAKNLLGNPAVWDSYARASRLALDSPDGRPRKDGHYLKHGKVRISDIWPEPRRGDVFQELQSEESALKVLSKTEAEAIRLSRIGQGRFRDSLLALWAKCSVTGCRATRILRASHLKPWKDATNAERLDPYNGLLLIPNLDAAFDVGLITFDDDGTIRLSSQLCSDDAASLGIVSTMKISALHKRHLKYLRYHRQNKFIE